MPGAILGMAADCGLCWHLGAQRVLPCTGWVEVKGKSQPETDIPPKYGLMWYSTSILGRVFPHHGFSSPQPQKKFLVMDGCVPHFNTVIGRTFVSNIGVSCIVLSRK